jgi:PTS system glucitol/sorbitol-specific IIA component
LIKYAAVVTEIGPLVTEFTEAGVLVFFGSEAPEELREFAIIHDGQKLLSDVIPGDLVCLGDDKFRVLAIGEIANQNLSALGHFIVKFNGADTPEMPGDICAEARPLPAIAVGMRLQIVSPE